MGSFDYVVSLVSDNPITASAVGLGAATVARFFRPIMERVQAALIRRIDQAWPDEGTDEDRVQRTVDAVRFPMPRSMVESAVRKHKSISPPSRDESGE